MHSTPDHGKFRQKRTDIHKAVLDGDLALVQKLIESGADLEQEDDDYATPLDLAVRSCNLEMVDTLLAAGALPSHHTLNIVVEDDELCGVAILSLLIKAGIDINDRLDEGETAIMFAAQSGNLDIVRMLAEAGADVNVVSRKGNFALLNAGIARYQEIFEYLIPLTSTSLRIKAAQQLPSRLARLLT